MRTLFSAIVIGCVIGAFAIAGLVRGKSKDERTAIPEVPVYPGGAVLKSFDVSVNLRPTKVRVIHTTDGTSKVVNHYLEILPQLGWIVTAGNPGAAGVNGEEGETARPVPQRVEVSATRGRAVFSVSVFRDEPTGGSYIFTRLEEAGKPKYRFLPRRAAAEKTRVPIFPGVREVLLVEEGQPHGTTTLLFDTEASIESVSRYYQRRFWGARKINAGSPRAPGGWTCDAYRLRGRRVGLNLLRIGTEGRTSVLLIVSDEAERRPLKGVFTRWLAGIT